MKITGPAPTLAATADTSHAGATTKVRFAKPGVYTFTTKPGEDFVKGVETIGNDP